MGKEADGSGMTEIDGELFTVNWKNLNYDHIYEQRIKRLQNLRDKPELVGPVKDYYKARPSDFINDFGSTFDPRNIDVGLPATVPFILFEKQEEYIEWLVERWRGREDGVVEKSRDMGVSWLCIAFSVWMWLYYPGAVIGFGSRKETYIDDLNNPGALFWKARMFVNLLPKELQPRGWDDKKHAPYMKIINPENGNSIIGESGDNIGRGNRTSIYFVDEAAFLERPDAVDAALSQTANCKIHVSTPNGAGNAFYKKAHGGQIKKFVFDWHDDPRKDEAWYEKQCASLDPAIVAQEIDRNYEASVSNAFIPGELVLAAQARGPADVKPMGGLRVGIDVARFGNDKTSITFRRGRVLLKQINLSQLDVAQVAGRARTEIAAYGEKPEQIAVDTIGIGAGVADMMRAWYPDRVSKETGRKIPVVVDVNAALRMSNGEHYNLRAFMWSEMREWLKTASIPNDQDLKTDLTALRYGYRGGELLLESKDDAKRRGVKSPDRGDSLALTFAIPSPPQPQASPRIPGFRATDSSMGPLG